MDQQRTRILSSLTSKMVSRLSTQQLALPEYNSDADFSWIQQRSNLPWLHLPISIPVEKIYQEIILIQDRLVDHRDQYGKHSGWRGFCIHGKSYDATREDTYYTDSRPYDWTSEAQQYMPETVDFFKNRWSGHRYQRLRVMLLEPGGFISMHSDHDVSKLSPVNIAITQPSGCKFVFEKHGEVPFVQGSAFWLDVSKNHMVFNNSDLPRWHIIVHQDCDHPDFQDLVVKCYHALYNIKNATGKTYNT